MNTSLFAFASLALVCAASACSTKTEPNPVPGPPPPTLAMTITPTTIAQLGKFHVKMAVTNFTIKDIGVAAEMAIESGKIAADPTVGHWHLYVDSTDTDPLEEDGTTLEKDLLLPCALAKPIDPGAHTLIGRLHFTSHKIVFPEVTSKVDVTVTKGTCTSGAGGGGSGGSGAGGKK